MPPGALRVSHFPGQHVPLDQTDHSRQMHVVSRKTAHVSPGLFSPCGSSLQLAERIEASEFQTTVIAKKFMQAGNPKDNQGVLVATLNSRTLTSRAPHSTGNLTNLMASAINNFFGVEKSTKS